MTNAVTWMWIGNHQQINTTPGTPATGTEADGMKGYKVVGQNQIKPVELDGQLRAINTAQGPAEAYATSYSQHPDGASKFAYGSPTDAGQSTSQITGFLKVQYKLTFPDNTTSTQDGVLIQMRNGDMFFRPAKDSVAAWSDVKSLHSVEIIEADPLPKEVYVAKISFAPDIHDMEIMCFAADTLILTADGPRPVDSLQPGDLIWTRDHGYQPLRWIGRRRFDAVDLAANPKLRPIRIAAGALGLNQPSAPLSVSRQHRIMIRSSVARTLFGTEEILAPACQLTDVPGIAVDMSVSQVTYCHLMFDAHQVVDSNGAQTESLYPGPQALRAMGSAALSELRQIFPELFADQAHPAEARTFVRGPRLRQLVQLHTVGQAALVS